MGVDFSTSIYLPVFDFYSRQATITPLASQPNAAPFIVRGIYDTEDLEVAAEDGSFLQSQRTIFDIREYEFQVLPVQGDHIYIPADRGAMGALGDFEIINAWTNGGGETTLQLRQIDTRP
jgi:hypothetical protein